MEALESSAASLPISPLAVSPPERRIVLNIAYFTKAFQNFVDDSESRRVCAAGHLT